MLKENKEKLKNALIEVANREADEAAASDTQDVCLSLSFQEKARKLIQETDGHRCRVNKKVVMLIAAALIIALCSVASYTCREHILSFINRTCEDYTTVTVKDQYNNKVRTNTTIEMIYTLSYVPKGYKEIAVSLGRKETTIKKQLTRAKQMLAKILVEEGYGAKRK